MDSRVLQRCVRVAGLLAGGLFVVSCGGDASGPTGTGGRGVPFRVVAGGGQTDTIGARPIQSLVVEIRDTTGALARGRAVRFEALPPDDPKRRLETMITVATLSSVTYTSFASDVADSSGRSKVLVGFGNIAGTARIRVTVPEFGRSDTVSFTVLPGAVSRLVVGLRDTIVQPSATYSLRATTVDRSNNPVSTEDVTYSIVSGSATVSSTGQVTVGGGPTRAVIRAAWKALADTGRVSVVPRWALVGSRYTTARTVVLVNTDGTGYSELAMSPDASLSAHTVKSSNKIVFYQGGPDVNAALWIASPGSAAQRLPTTTPTFVSMSWPRMSPDGGWIYFIGTRSLAGARVLWRTRLDGSQTDSLTVVNAPASYFPSSPSPDGRSVAIEDASGIRVIDLATKAATVVKVTCGQPHYSPDGSRFACIRAGVVSVMNIDGTGQRNLNSASGIGDGFDDLSSVDWSPDGAWLIARSNFTLGGMPTLVSVANGEVIPLNNTLSSAYTQLSFVR